MAMTPSYTINNFWLVISNLSTNDHNNNKFKNNSKMAKE